MGGRAAEDIVYGPDRATTGAASDLSVATQLAEAMVKLYGMSDKVRTLPPPCPAPALVSPVSSCFSLIPLPRFTPARFHFHLTANSWR